MLIALCATGAARSELRLAESHRTPQSNADAPQVPPQKQADGGLKKQENAQPDKHTPASPKDERRDNASEASKEPPETYVAFGKSLKVTDSLIAVFTLVIAIFTIGLYCDGREKSRKELRAYVALDHIFFNTKPTVVSHVMPDESTHLLQVNEIDFNDLRIRIRNYGKTPAHSMTIRCEPTYSAPPLGQRYRITQSLVDEQMLHPDQPYETQVKVAPKYEFTAKSYVVGRVAYRDIHNAWWETDFCYRYEGNGKFTPYGDHNRERGPHKGPLE